MFICRRNTLLICHDAKGSVYEQAETSGEEHSSYTGGKLASRTVKLYHFASARADNPALPEFIEAPITAVWTAIVYFVTARSLNALLDYSKMQLASLPPQYRVRGRNGEAALNEAAVRGNVELTFHVPGQAHDDKKQFVRGCYRDAFGPGASAEAQAVLGGPFDPVSHPAHRNRLAIITEPRSALVTMVSRDSVSLQRGERYLALSLDLGGEASLSNCFLSLPGAVAGPGRWAS